MENSLTHHLLVAMPLLEDAFFNRSVVYILQHDDAGAMGLIINKPVAMTQADLLTNLEIPTSEPDPGAPKKEPPPLVFGGPVMRERGFVLHAGNGDWESTLSNDYWQITTSKDIMQALARDEGPTWYQICLGHSGWDAGQLEQELAANAWLVVPADETLVFTTPPYKRYDAALDALGIDPAQLGAGGHA